jgi:hypothetical protein
MFLRTAGIYVQVHMALQPTRTTWTEMIHDRFYVLKILSKTQLLYLVNANGLLDGWTGGHARKNSNT